MSALGGLDALDVRPGDTLLILGATGGVGSFAVQLAAQRGATVVATATAGDADAFVRALGALETIDHTAGDLAEAVRARFPDGVHALLDLLSRDDAFVRMAGTVRDGGRIATTQSVADVAALASRGIHATNIMASPTPAKLTLLAEQVVAGTLRVEIQQAFPLAETSAALAAYLGGTRGKLVLTMA